MYRRAVFCLLFLLLLSSAAWGRYIQWKPQDKPPVSLKEAMVLAEKEIEKQEGTFFCIGASLAKTFTAGDWELRFSSAKGKDLWVSVGSDKSTRVSTEGFEY